MNHLSHYLVLPILGAVILAAIFFLNTSAPPGEDMSKYQNNEISGGVPVEGSPAETFWEPPGASVADENLLPDARKEQSKEILAESTGALSNADPDELRRKSRVITDSFTRNLFPDLQGVIDPVSIEGVYELLELLKGFGELISSPEGILSQEFSELDAKIIAKTKEVYRNPHQTLPEGGSFVLGEQCGLSGGAFSFPPGFNDLTTACGGTPPIGGTEGAPNTGTSGTCNTDPPCYFTGFCFQECYTYRNGGYCYCWVPSCYGVCGNSTYIWDSVAGTCGCGQ